MGRRVRYSCPLCTDPLYLGRGGIWYDDDGRRRQTNDIDDDPWWISETGQLHHACLMDFAAHLEDLDLPGRDAGEAAARAALASWWALQALPATWLRRRMSE